MFHSNYHLILLFILIFFNVCMIFICCFDSLDRNLHVVTELNKSAHLREWSGEVLQTCGRRRVEGVSVFWKNWVMWRVVWPHVKEKCSHRYTRRCRSGTLVTHQPNERKPQSLFHTVRGIVRPGNDWTCRLPCFHTFTCFSPPHLSICCVKWACLVKMKIPPILLLESGFQVLWVGLTSTSCCHHD